MSYWIHLKLLVCTILMSVMMLNCKKKESNSSEKSTQNSFISVAAAANLRDVLEDLKQIYIKENPDKKVEITFGSSGLLVQQILNGAPFDLFLSADTQFPEKLKSAGKNYGNPKIYAYGKVVLWSSKKDVSKGLDLLQNPEINKIAIANPELAPYGKNTVEALKKSGLYSKIENKIVWAENISQVAQFASTGNADVGFIALSNAKNKDMMRRGNFYELSEKECAPIAQSGIVLKGKSQTESQDFFDFINSEKANEIWKRYGYQTKISK